MYLEVNVKNKKKKRFQIDKNKQKLKGLKLKLDPFIGLKTYLIIIKIKINYTIFLKYIRFIFSFI